MCNGGLCNWESTDTPWYEHNKWFGRCQYVMKAKKHEVVKVIIETAAQLNVCSFHSILWLITYIHTYI